MELSNMQPHKARGIAPAGNIVGVLDFLRELVEEPFPFARLSEWQIVGLEEVLFAARPQEAEVAADIHRRLNRAASHLDNRPLGIIQVVFSGEIVRGADLTVKYRGTALPIHLIFNHPPVQHDSNGNPFYPMEFHLSSP